MPTFAPPSSLNSESTGSSGQDSEFSYKTVEEYVREIDKMATDLPDVEYSALRITDPIAIANESRLRCDEMRNMLEEMRIRENTRIAEVDSIRSDMKELLSLMRSKVVEDKSPSLTQTINPTFTHEYPESSSVQKLKPIKWPEPYTHEDQSQWTTTHGILKYIYKRDVQERKFLHPGDFFMTLFSHAVSGTAKLMITGQFQEMMAKGQTDDALGLLTAMDDTFRDRNEEQTAAALFHSCRQFRDESLSSFLPRFQQLLARSPSSSGDEKNKTYQLWNSLNQVTRNHLIGRPLPSTFREFIEFLSATGSQIEEVGLVKTKRYLIGKVGIFDDGTRGVAGGRLLGANVAPTPHSSPITNLSHEKDADGDIRMTGVNKLRAKWVSRDELERRMADGKCIRCGKKGHHISKCHLLPPQKPGISVKTTVLDKDEILHVNEEGSIQEELKD